MENIDYDTQQVDIERARRMAELLRQQAGQRPQGKMVGRFYVAADPMQHLASLVSDVVANYKEKEADKKQSELAAKQNQAFQSVLEAMPQRKVLTRSVTPDVGARAPANLGAMPVTPQNVNAQATAVQPVEETEVVNPTRQDMLQWAGQMYRLPMARQLATKLMTDYTGQAKKTPIGHIGALDQDTGEMIPFGPGIELEKAQLAQRAIDLSLRLQDKQLDRNLREQLAEQLRQTQVQIAAMRQPDSRLTDARIASLEAQAALASAKAGATGQSSTKPMPKYMDEKFSGMVETIDTLDRQLKTFKDKFANQGLLGDTKRKAAAALGSWGSKDWQEMDSWWRSAERQDELLERFKLFGATLTSNELASWRNATIRPGLSAEKVREFLQARQNILKRKLTTELKRVKTDGKYEVEGTEEMLRDRGHFVDPSIPANNAPVPRSDPLSGAKVRKVR